MNYFWVKYGGSHSISKFIDKKDLKKLWGSLGKFPQQLETLHSHQTWCCQALPKATSDYLLSDTAVNWVISTEDKRGLCKRSWTHLNAAGRAFVLPLSNLFTFAYCKWQGIATEPLMPAALQTGNKGLEEKEQTALPSLNTIDSKLPHRKCTGIIQGG